MNKKIILSIALLGIITQTNAQQEEKHIEEVTVASKSAQKINKTGRNITLLTEKDLEKYQGQTLSDVLEQVPGLQISGNFNNNTETKVLRARGGSDANVIILIDGIPLQNVTGATSNIEDLRLLALDNISSIEILNGASSVLYGSNATTAIIDIKTKKYANGKEKGIYYVNGKVANGYENGIYYVNGKLGDWWLDDGKDWYFFKNGKKFTGVAKDSSGEHKFINGKYAAATGNGSDGLSNVLSIAQSYLGVEMGSAEHKKIVDAYNSVNPKPVGYTVKYSDDWCDVFVTTVFQQAGLSSLIGRECGVQRHIGIMQQKGIWQGKVLPKAGDVITFDWDGGGFADHIGIVESVKDGVVTTIEGNSSTYGSSARTKVKRNTYNWNASYIKGYARPNY